MSDATKGTRGKDAAPYPAGTARQAPTGRPPRRGRVRAAANAVRSRLATVTWLGAVTCALFLAVGALLIALNANEKNTAVDLVLSVAAYLDGPFSLSEGVFTFADDRDGRVRSALVNWGIAAVVYLVIGKILDRVIRP